MNYTPRTFNLPKLNNLSEKQIAVHLALYEGYVKHANLIMDTIEKLRTEDAAGHTYTINELRRRFGFEFDGMRLHEYYFEQFEGGTSALPADSALGQLSLARYGETQGLASHIREVAGTRGIGWVIVYFDPHANTLQTAWVSDHELGQLSGLPILLALDLWEHAFMVDYVPAEKKSYIDAFFENLNWEVVNVRLQQASK